MANETKKIAPTLLMGWLVRDLVPVLDDNGVPCMYDKVSRRAFYNQGTGEFLYALAVSA